MAEILFEEVVMLNEGEPYRIDSVGLEGRFYYARIDDYVKPQPVLVFRSVDGDRDVSTRDIRQAIFKKIALALSPRREDRNKALAGVIGKMTFDGLTDLTLDDVALLDKDAAAFVASDKGNDFFREIAADFMGRDLDVQVYETEERPPQLLITGDIENVFKRLGWLIFPARTCLEPLASDYGKMGAEWLDNPTRPVTERDMRHLMFGGGPNLKIKNVHAPVLGS